LNSGLAREVAKGFEAKRILGVSVGLAFDEGKTCSAEAMKDNF
jgi:hypothetical protein